jgi:hypothetical protein
MTPVAKPASDGERTVPAFSKQQRDAIAQHFKRAQMQKVNHRFAICAHAFII